MDKETEFYEKLKKSLEETTTFPSQYLFKFIIPSDNKKFKEIEDVFNNLGAVINSKPSSGGKYTSISIHVKMNSSDEIIAKYQEVGKVEGVISL
jgi:hypothetical protein